MRTNGAVREVRETVWRQYYRFIENFCTTVEWEKLDWKLVPQTDGANLPSCEDIGAAHFDSGKVFNCKKGFSLRDSEPGAHYQAWYH